MECDAIVIGGWQCQFSVAPASSAKRETLVVTKFTVVLWAKVVSSVPYMYKGLRCGLQEKGILMPMCRYGGIAEDIQESKAITWFR